MGGYRSRSMVVLPGCTTQGARRVGQHILDSKLSRSCCERDWLPFVGPYCWKTTAQDPVLMGSPPNPPPIETLKRDTNRLYQGSLPPGPYLALLWKSGSSWVGLGFGFSSLTRSRTASPSSGCAAECGSIGKSSASQRYLPITRITF